MSFVEVARSHEARQDWTKSRSHRLGGALTSGLGDRLLRDAVSGAEASGRAPSMAFARA
jgi:hypothetical protein